MRRYLSSDESVAIVGECADGASAVSAIRTLRPDIVLLDVQMPELDGFEVLRCAGRVAGGDFRDCLRSLRAASLRSPCHRLPAEAVHPRPFVPGGDPRQGPAARTHSDEALAALAGPVADRARMPVGVAVRTRNRIVVVDWAESTGSRPRTTTCGCTLDGPSTCSASRWRRSRRSSTNASSCAYTARQWCRWTGSRSSSRRRTGDFTLRLRDGAELTLTRTFRERVERTLGCEQVLRYRRPPRVLTGSENLPNLPNLEPVEPAEPAEPAEPVVISVECLP